MLEWMKWKPIIIFLYEKKVFFFLFLTNFHLTHSTNATWFVFMPSYINKNFPRPIKKGRMKDGVLLESVRWERGEKSIENRIWCKGDDRMRSLWIPSLFKSSLCLRKKFFSFFFFWRIAIIDRNSTIKDDSWHNKHYSLTLINYDSRYRRKIPSFFYINIITAVSQTMSKREL